MHDCLGKQYRNDSICRYENVSTCNSTLPREWRYLGLTHNYTEIKRAKFDGIQCLVRVEITWNTATKQRMYQPYKECAYILYPTFNSRAKRLGLNTWWFWKTMKPCRAHTCATLMCLEAGCMTSVVSHWLPTKIFITPAHNDPHHFHTFPFVPFLWHNGHNPEQNRSKVRRAIIGLPVLHFTG